MATPPPAVQQEAVQAVLDKHWAGFKIEKLLKPSQNYTYLATAVGIGGKPDTKVVVRAVPKAKDQLPRIEGEATVLHFLKSNHSDLPTTSLIPRMTTPPSSEEENSEDSSVRGLYIALGTQELLVEGEEEKEPGVTTPTGQGDVKKVDPTIAVTVCSFADGREVSIVSGEWMTSKQIAVTVGRWLGRFHKLMVDAPEEVGAQVRSWRELHDAVLKDVPVDPQDELLVNDPQHFGILHGDINAGNYFVLEEEEGSSEKVDLGVKAKKVVKDVFVFDWDQVQLGWYMFDLAQVCHGVEMMMAGGAPWLPVTSSGEGKNDASAAGTRGGREEVEAAITAAHKQTVLEYGVIEGVPADTAESFTKWAVEGYEAGRNSGEEGGTTNTTSAPYKVDAAHLDRMKGLRQTFYRLFAERELANPSLPEGMHGFCKYIIHADRKMTELKNKK